MNCNSFEGCSVCLRTQNIVLSPAGPQLVAMCVCQLLQGTRTFLFYRSGRMTTDCHWDGLAVPGNPREWVWSTVTFLLHPVSFGRNASLKTVCRPWHNAERWSSSVRKPGTEAAMARNCQLQVQLKKEIFLPWWIYWHRVYIMSSISRRDNEPGLSSPASFSHHCWHQGWLPGSINLMEPPGLARGMRPLSRLLSVCSPGAQPATSCSAWDAEYRCGKVESQSQQTCTSPQAELLDGIINNGYFRSLLWNNAKEIRSQWDSSPDFGNVSNDSGVVPQLTLFLETSFRAVGIRERALNADFFFSCFVRSIFLPFLPSPEAAYSPPGPPACPSFCLHRACPLFDDTQAEHLIGRPGPGRSILCPPWLCLPMGPLRARAPEGLLARCCWHLPHPPNVIVNGRSCHSESKIRVYQFCYKVKCLTKNVYFNAWT